MNGNRQDEDTADRPPDERIEVPGGAGGASLWWSRTPHLDGVRTGAVGAFDARDADSAHRVLSLAGDRLRAAGAEIAIGPMDGSTWRRYRWMVESDGRGPFLLEPWNPPGYPEWWKACGFGRLASYSSSIVDPESPPGTPNPVRERFDRSGFVIRRLDASGFGDELRVIHDLSLRSFTGNFLYSPMSYECFAADYAKIAGAIDPDCVLIVERDGSPCAFLFGIPDLAAAKRGEKPALIAKTLAVLPEFRRHGMGSILLDEFQSIARAKGYREIIHALQHESNQSLAITARLGHRVFRRYELLAKRL